MNFIEELKQEHEEIENELKELENIMQDGDINYSNLHHTFIKLCDIWNKHEEKEEIIFPIMEKEQIIIPVKKMLCEHRELRPHKNAIIKALLSGSQIEMKDALNNHAIVIIDKFRKHIEDEENILYSITIEIFTQEEISEIEKSIS